MRATKSDHGLTVKAYSGTTGVLLAMDIDDNAAPRKGLLGFAIKRINHDRQGMLQEKWLEGLLFFPHQRDLPKEKKEPLDSRDVPIQKFRWSDYTVYPGQEYTYEVHPVYGTPEVTDVRAGVAVTVRTMGTDGQHVVMFNRAAAASQAFSRRFPGEAERIKQRPKKPKPPKGEKKKKTKEDVEEDERNAETLLSPGAFAWLARGADELIVEYIKGAAGAGSFLDIAIYEYELTKIRQAVVEAARRGVTIRLIYHAKKNDEQTEVNETFVKALTDLNLGARVEVLPRPTSKIMHNKYIVRGTIAGDKRQPEAVLCGSTNFTLNGVYRQANVVHIARDRTLATTYEQMFEALRETHQEPPKTRTKVDQLNPIVPDAAIFAGFSPRSGEHDLNEFVRVINGAKRDVLFCTAFQLPERILDALAGADNDPILRYGLQNTASRITGINADRTDQFAAAAYLKDGLEDWFKESTQGQKGNILIHTKLVVVDFTSDNPVVISGSHNLSVPASGGNDENYLIIRGNTDVADAYGCELMRFYDHYRARWVHQSSKKSKGKNTTQAHVKGSHGWELETSDAWTDGYFDPGSLKHADRIRFAGTARPEDLVGDSSDPQSAPKKPAAKKKVATKKSVASKVATKGAAKVAKKKAAVKPKAAKKKVAKKKTAKKKAAKKKA